MKLWFIKKFKFSGLILFICIAFIFAALFLPSCGPNTDSVIITKDTIAAESDSSKKDRVPITDNADKAESNNIPATNDYADETRPADETGPADNSIIFSFTVCGDSRPADDYLPQPDVFLKILNLVKNENPAFNMSVGDIINGGTDDAKIIKREFSDYLDALKILSVTSYVTPGNHDTQNNISRKYFLDMINMKAFTESIAKGVQIFVPDLNSTDENAITIKSINLNSETDIEGLAELSGLYYYFNFEEVHFIVLNAFENGYWGAVKSNQLKWLETVLESIEEGRIFIFIHTPVYSILNPDTITDGSKHVAFSSKENLLFIKELFKKYKVDAVFSGHEHLYNLQSHDGTTYVITALSGEYPFVSREEGGFYHFIRVDIKKNSWIFSVIESDGNLYFQEEIPFN